MPTENKDRKEKLLQLLRNAMSQDNELRDKYKMGEKFRFIRDRLHSLVTRIEENLKTLQLEDEKTKVTLREDEILVYVYLYNAQGLVFQTWQKLLTPSVFYEYSVNRPIYADRSLIESFIRNKTNKAQHGYLTVAIKRDHILPTPDHEVTKDQFGNPLIKIKEGSLAVDRLIAFTHNENHYRLDQDGVLQKINDHD